ncbi:MAG: hypothetical protein V1695_03170 [Candidatus Uhrbacteria bacterium]
MIVVMVIVIVVALDGGDWLREYWRDNVISWKIVCWKEADHFIYQLMRRGQTPEAMDYGTHILSIPLGGWWICKSSLLKYGEVVDVETWIRDLLFGAKVTLSFHGVMCDPDSNQLGFWLLWRDQDKMRVPVRLEHALEMIWDCWLEPMDRHQDMSLRRLFHHERGQLQIARQTLENLRQRRCELDRGRMMALTLADSMALFLHRLVEWIGDTSRFGPSKEGKTLRIAIEEFLAEHLPDGHRYKERYVRRCTDRLQAGRSGGQQIEATQVE